MAPRASRVARLVGAVITFAALSGAVALRLHDLGADLWFSNLSYADDLSLNFEEKASALAARNWALFGDADSYGGIYQPQALMPLGFLAHAGWYAAAGVSLVSTRMPFALAAAATLLAMTWLARRQLGPATLAAFAILAGWNATLVAWQRSSLDENLLLTGLVAMALCAPTPYARPRAFALWGLLAFVAAATKANGALFAAAPIVALAIDLARERRGRSWRSLAALAAGVAAATAATVALYAALGFFRPNPFHDWLAQYNRARGLVPPLAGLPAYLKAFAHHLPVPGWTERPVLLLVLGAPLLLRRTTFFTRAAWWGVVLAFVAGAPLYVYYKRLVPVAPLVLYLAAAGTQGLVERTAAAWNAFAAALAARRHPAALAAALRGATWAVLAGVAGWTIAGVAADGLHETLAGNPREGPPPGYQAMARGLVATLPPGAMLAAPDTFRLVAFDTPFAYHFTHDMVARHVEHISLAEAVRRDARDAGAEVMVLPAANPGEPGRRLFRVVLVGDDPGPAGPEAGDGAGAAAVAVFGGGMPGAPGRFKDGIGAGAVATGRVFPLDRGRGLP